MPRLPKKRTLPSLKRKPLKSYSSTSIQSMRVGGWGSRSTELKYIDNNFSPVIAVGSASFSLSTQLLNGCTQGSDATNRIGRKLVLKSCLVRGTFTLASTSTGGSPIRLVLVYDKQANAAAPATTDVFLADNFSSQNNLNNRDRFIILSDFISDPIAASGNFSIGFKMYKKMNLETMFNGGNAGTVADITSGALYLFMAQNGSIATAAPTLNLRTRVRFIDA